MLKSRSSVRIAIDAIYRCKVARLLTPTQEAWVGQPGFLTLPTITNLARELLQSCPCCSRDRVACAEIAAGARPRTGCRPAAAMGNTPPAPACSNPNEVSLAINGRWCCEAHYALRSRARRSSTPGVCHRGRVCEEARGAGRDVRRADVQGPPPREAERHRCVVALVF